MNLKQRREAAGLSQSQLARLSNITPQRIVRLEQYISPNLPSSVSRALSLALMETDAHCSPKKLEDEYAVERAKQIAEFRAYFPKQHEYSRQLQIALDYAVDFCEPTRGNSPVGLFRRYLFEHYGYPHSAIKFSMFTGLHPAVLSSAENGKVPWENLTALEKVLRDIIKLPDAGIKQLATLHDNYFLTRII